VYDPVTKQFYDLSVSNFSLKPGGVSFATEKTLSDLTYVDKKYNKYDPFKKTHNGYNTTGGVDVTRGIFLLVANPPFTQKPNVEYNPHQATLIGFDKEGKKLWDNHFIFKNLTSAIDYIKHPRLQIGTMGDSLVLAYFSQTGLTSTLIHQGNTIKKEVFQTYKSLFPVSFDLEHYYHFECLEGNSFVLQGDYTNPQNGETVMFLRLMRYVNKE